MLVQVCPPAKLHRTKRRHSWRVPALLAAAVLSMAPLPFLSGRALGNAPAPAPSPIQISEWFDTLQGYDMLYSFSGNSINRNLLPANSGGKSTLFLKLAAPPPAQAVRPWRGLVTVAPACTAGFSICAEYQTINDKPAFLRMLSIRNDATSESHTYAYQPPTLVSVEGPSYDATSATISQDAALTDSTFQCDPQSSANGVYGLYVACDSLMKIPSIDEKVGIYTKSTAFGANQIAIWAAYNWGQSAANPEAQNFDTIYAALGSVLGLYAEDNGYVSYAVLLGPPTGSDIPDIYPTSARLTALAAGTRQITITKANCGEVPLNLCTYVETVDFGPGSINFMLMTNNRPLPAPPPSGVEVPLQSWANDSDADGVCVIPPNTMINLLLAKFMRAFGLDVSSIVPSTPSGSSNSFTFTFRPPASDVDMSTYFNRDSLTATVTSLPEGIPHFCTIAIVLPDGAGTVEFHFGVRTEISDGKLLFEFDTQQPQTTAAEQYRKGIARLTSLLSESFASQSLSVPPSDPANIYLGRLGDVFLPEGAVFFYKNPSFKNGNLVLEIYHKGLP